MEVMSIWGGRKSASKCSRKTERHGGGQAVCGHMTRFPSPSPSCLFAVPPLVDQVSVVNQCVQLIYSLFSLNSVPDTKKGIQIHNTLFYALNAYIHKVVVCGDGACGT